MAVALEKLEDQLNCSICLGIFTNPKQLQCHHAYCQQCLVKLMIQDQQGHFTITCPYCRQITPVPASGLASLPTAFQINKFLELIKEHKKKVVSMVTSEKRVSALESFTPHGNTIICPEHGGKKEVDLYCETCTEMICWKCIKKGEKHHSHDYIEINEAFEKYKGEIHSSLEAMEKQLRSTEKALIGIDVRCDEITKQQNATEIDIHNTITQIHEALDIRKGELIRQLQKITQLKLKNLAAQRDKIGIVQAQLSSHLLLLKESLKANNQRNLLLIKSTIVKQIEEHQTDILKPNTEADMIFSALADLATECQNYGEVLTTTPFDPSKCCVTGKGVDKATVGKKATVLLQVLNSNSNPCKVSVDSISCEVVSELTGTVSRGSVKGKGQTKYEINYQPTIKGKHQLHIKIKDHHITGSPFPVITTLPVEELGIPIQIIGGVLGPIGIAVNQKGEIAVTEWREHYISMYCPSGRKIQSYGTRGSGQGQFQYPSGVTVDKEENILVADSNNNRIQKFTAQGKFLTAEDVSGGGPLHFSPPDGIAFNASNGMVYVVCKGGCIQILSSDLSYFGTMGKRGNGKGQFEDPRHITCDSTGNLYVADRGNHRIQVFTAEGKFLRMFGKHGEDEGELNGPCGIAVDSSDRVYVSEWDNHRISVFTSEGQFLASFGSKGKGPGQFKYPCGLAVDNSGVVYVCDHYNNRIQLF